VTRTAFITSTGRTGTGFLTRLFNDCVSGAFSLHEPKPAFRRRSIAWMGRPPSVLERWRFARTRNGFMAGRPEALYVENNFQLFAALPLIREVFPDSRIIHIVRDGRAVTTSFLNRFRYITSDHITPDDVADDSASERWDGWSPVQKLAWYWSTVNRHVVGQDPDLVVRFEDMFDEDRSGLWRLLDCLDLEYDRGPVLELASKRVNTNKSEFFPPYDEWPRSWQEQFWEVAGAAMEEFGYLRE